ncbi:putative HIT zinc finger [Trypanosoma cruzi]|nr:putative HIT zinc finger [Trypanosoma cruzi]
MVLCVVCGRENARYRCRNCRAAYCCSACHKTHRDPERPNHCESLQPPSNETGGKNEVEESTDRTDAKEFQTPSSNNGNTALGGHDARLKRGREGETNFIEGERDEDGELVVLGEAHLSELAHDTNIRKKLLSSELQQLLRVIDASRSRIDALEAAMANTPEFKEFCDEVLGVVSAAERGLRPGMKLS